MRIRIAFLCGLAAIVCIVIGLMQVYVDASILPAPFSFTSRALLIAAGVILLFGINSSLCKLSSKKD